MPREHCHAHRPAGPNRSSSTPSGMAATSPMVRRPKRLRPVCTSSGDGQQVYRVGREEGPDVLGDLARAERLGGPGGDEGRELGARHADARGQVGGDGVQQRADDAGLPAVQPLQTVHLHVGGPKLRALDTIADRLKGGEHPAEDLAVGGLVGLDDGGVGVA